MKNSMGLLCLMVGLLWDHNWPLHWCSAYISSRHCSSSVKTRSLYYDLGHHSMAERTLTCVPLQLRLCGEQERLRSICGGPGTAFTGFSPHRIDI